MKMGIKCALVLDILHPDCELPREIGRDYCTETALDFQEISTLPDMGFSAQEIVIVGDGMCGKTSVLQVLLNNRYPVSYVPTVCENYTTTMNTKGKNIPLSMWDTAVQEDFAVFRPLLYRRASVFIVMYSVDRPESLENVYERWVPEVRQYNKEAPIILVATKTDLRHDPSTIARLSEDDLVPISTTEGKTMARKINAFSYTECSALANRGVREVLKKAIDAVQVKKQKKNFKMASKKLRDSFTVKTT